VKGVLLGCFGPPGETSKTKSATHVVVVNLDYKSEATLGIRGLEPLERFDAVTAEWSTANGARVELRLPRGGGELLRVRR
jgi:hypothetical protein